MRITESQLRRIIREESKVIAESSMLRDASILSSASYKLRDAISLVKNVIETNTLDPESQMMGDELIRLMKDFSNRCFMESNSLRKAEKGAL